MLSPLASPAAACVTRALASSAARSSRSRAEVRVCVRVQGCKKKGAGYVTFHKGNARSEGAATACIQTPGGQGICWPGGASGYNINQFLDA